MEICLKILEMMIESWVWIAVVGFPLTIFMLKKGLNK